MSLCPSVNRSIRRKPGDAPARVRLEVRRLTTSVVPSHRPRASPMYVRIAGDSGGSRGSSSGMTRVS